MTTKMSLRHIIFLHCNAALIFASLDEDRLLGELFRGYNHLIRPVRNASSGPIEVSFSLALELLINVDEKNQIMQTNVWPTMKWFDYHMQWNPLEYNKIKTIRVSSDKVWLPDIVLFNNADGNYEVSFYSNVVVEFTGQMLWVPPAIYKSACTIDVEFFPFDEQTCLMIFGSWTYGKEEVILTYLEGKRNVELNDYSRSGIWDVMDVPGELTESRSKITYNIKIRRKTLFYTVILIIPTVLMAFLSIMVFYLPVNAGEKITLGVSVMLGLVVFLLLVSRILPPTSSTIPLMAKYLLMTFIMNISTIFVTVIIINVYFRSPNTHRIPKWVKTVFMRFLPLLLMIKRPSSDRRKKTRQQSERQKKSDRRRHGKKSSSSSSRNGEEEFVFRKKTAFAYPEVEQLIDLTCPQVHHPYCSQNNAQNQRQSEKPSIFNCTKDSNTPDTVFDAMGFSRDDARKALAAIEYIAEHLRQEIRMKQKRDDWKFIAMVIDRLLLYIFFAITAGGTVRILFAAPTIFEYVDQEAVIARLSNGTKQSPFLF